MPIENINLLQNSIDLRGLKQEDDYYIQALANLGQRTSLNSQSIKYNTFTFSDVLANSNVMYSADDYIGVMLKQDDTILFNVADKRELSRYYPTISSITTSIEEKNINDKLYLNNDIAFNMSVNNVDKISQIGSLLGIDDNYFISSLRVKLLGTDDKDDDNIEAQWTKINLNTGALHSAIRAFHLKDNDYVMLTVCQRDGKTSGSDYKIYYDLSCYILNTDTITDENKDNVIKDFKEYFKYYSTPEEYISYDLCDKTIEEILYVDDEDVPTNIFAFINKYRYYEEISNYTITLEYDTLRNVRLSISDESVMNAQYNNIDDIMKYDTLGLYHRITCLNDDIEITFPNLLNLWTTNLFNHDHTTFVKRMFIKLYERILNDNRTDMDTTAPVMFVPLDYKFNYISDGSNVLYLYYTDDLYVSLINLKQFNSQELYEFLTQHQNIIFNYDDVDKVKIYNIYTQRNARYDEYVNNIIVNERYTLPYVNAQNSWQINDIDTHIRAVGKNAGKPNLIILKQLDDVNESGHHYMILHCSEIERLQQYDEVYYEDDKLYFPRVTSNNIDLFENALLMYILQDESVFYHLKQNKFELIMVDESSLNIKSLFNVGQTIINTIKDTNIAKSNKFELVVFENETSLYNQQPEGDAEHFVVKQKQLDSTNNKSNTELIIFRADGIDDDEYLVKDVTLTHDKHIDAYLKPENKRVYKDYIEYELVTITTHVPAVDAINDAQVDELVSFFNEQNYDMFITTVVRNGESTIYPGEIEYTLSGYRQLSSHDEYLPETNIPLLKLSDVFLRDVNTVNRENIISFDKNGDMYYSYIGTVYDSDDKTTLHIGTSTTNINVGKDTMISVNNEDEFKKQDKISIDFDEIYLNTLNLNSNTTLIEKHDINDVEYMTIRTDAFGSCLKGAADVFEYSINSETNNVQIQTRLIHYDGDNSNEYVFDNMFVIMREAANVQSLDDKYFLNLNVLLKKYGIDLTEYTVGSGDNMLKLYYTMVDPNDGEIKSHIDVDYSMGSSVDNIYTTAFGTNIDKYIYLLYVGNANENILSTIGDNNNLYLLRDLYITLWKEVENNILCIDVHNKNTFNKITTIHVTMI